MQKVLCYTRKTSIILKNVRSFGCKYFYALTKVLTMIFITPNKIATTVSTSAVDSHLLIRQKKKYRSLFAEETHTQRDRSSSLISVLI